MKALIVIEIPDDHLLVTANDLFERLKGYKCDLKPMPDKKPVSYHDELFGDVENLTNVGWNLCLEEIEK